MCIDDIWWENLPLLVLNFYELIAIVATSGRYGCTIVMSHTEINKTVSQWSLTFNQCFSISWPLTCVFHVSCMCTPEIIDMHRDVCDVAVILKKGVHLEKICIFIGLTTSILHSTLLSKYMINYPLIDFWQTATLLKQMVSNKSPWWSCWKIAAILKTCKYFDVHNIKSAF